MKNKASTAGLATKLQRPQTAFDLQKRLMEEPGEERRSTFLETINKPISKLFSR